MLDLKNHINLALAYFVLAAVLGVVLRSFHSIEIPLTYKFIVHTHSHIALLGWVYVGMTTLLVKLYLKNQLVGKRYRRIFWFTQATLIGMLLTFPFQGYALFSIIFSTFFLFASYWFTWFFIKNVPASLKKTNSFKCIKFALWFMVLSSLGPWVLGGIMNTLGAGSIWYRLAIYFYLHFQYNGWMILALIGLLFYVMEENNIEIPARNFKRFFYSINLGIVFTFFLSTLWTNPSSLFFVLGGLGALFQIIAFGILLMPSLKFKKRLSQIFSPFQRNLLLTLTILFGIKIALQLLTALPYFSNLAATITDFTIGYLHWTFLGVVTLGLFLFVEYYKMLHLNKWFFYLYLMGFFATEVLIFGKGIVVWQRLPLFEGYFEALALASIWVPLVLFFILMGNLKVRE